jgi:hypothetical protein
MVIILQHKIEVKIGVQDHSIQRDDSTFIYPSDHLESVEGNIVRGVAVERQRYKCSHFCGPPNNRRTVAEGRLAVALSEAVIMHLTR